MIRAVNRGLSIPILITENGIGTDDDPRRIAFIKRSFEWREGVTVVVSPLLVFMRK